MAFAPMTGEWDYVLREERELPPEKRTVWRLGSLAFRDLEEIVGRAVGVGAGGEVTVTSNPMVQARRILNRGLRGWSNFKRPDGSDVQFRSVEENGRRILPEEVLDAVTLFAIELANAITEGAKLTEEQRKNCGSP